jgi:hypothetical protein
MAQGSSPVDRWQGVRGLSGGSSAWVWVVVVVAGAAGAAVAGAMLHKWNEARKALERFSRQAREAGLDSVEQELLARIARLAGLKAPAAIFSAEEAFHRAVVHLVQRRPHGGVFDEVGGGLGPVLEALGQKMGFSAPSDSPERLLTSSRHIIAGDLSVVPADAGEPFAAEVVDTTSSELLLRVPGGIDGRPGQVWKFRHANGGWVWEFDSKVLRVEGTLAAIRHCDSVRLVNRRRFARVPTERPARVARFPFCCEQPGRGSPAFEEATLIEIAGPGLLLRTGLAAAVGERLLVTVRFGRQVLQGVGRARRVTPDAPGGPLVAVEMVGLCAAEVAEVARKTSQAAIENARVEAPAPQPGQAATTPTTTTQRAAV